MNKSNLTTIESVEAAIRKIKDDPYILETSNFAQLFSHVCPDSRQNKNLVGVIGDPGLGKSTALQKYANKHPHTYLVSVGKSMNPKQFYGSFLERIMLNQTNVYNKVNNDFYKTLDKEQSDDQYEVQRKLLNKYEALVRFNNDSKVGLKSGWTLNDIIRRITDNLNATAIEFETNNLVIIDEAGGFSKPSHLEYLREIRNGTEQSTGIIIAGPPYWRKTLIQWSERGINGIPEIMSRISYWVELEVPKGNEIREIAKAYGITDKEVLHELKSCRNFRSVMHGIEMHLKARMTEIKEAEEENQSMLNLNNKMYATN